MPSILMVVWSALKNRGETLQVSWSGRMADNRTFLRPVNHLDEAAEEGESQDLGREGGGGNSRNSWTWQGIWFQCMFSKRNGMLEDGHRRHSSCALNIATPFQSIPHWAASMIQLDESCHQTERPGSALQALKRPHLLQNIFWAPELANNTLSHLRYPSSEGTFPSPAGDNIHLPVCLPQRQILHRMLQKYSCSHIWCY